MANLRYNRAFKRGLAAILFCMLLFGSIVVIFLVSKVQYDRLVSNMKLIEATIVDIDLDVHIKGPDEQEIYIEYEVDGIVYSRELKTDTTVSFEAGRGAQYSVGDKIEIFYDPQNPAIIASPRSVGVGYFYLVIGLLSLALVCVCLIVVLKNRRKFLVTQAEYEKERERAKEELRRNKLARESAKAKKKQENAKYTVLNIIVKTILIILAVVVGGCVFLLLLGALLTALGY